MVLDRSFVVDFTEIGLETSFLERSDRPGRLGGFQNNLSDGPAGVWGIPLVLSDRREEPWGIPLVLSDRWEAQWGIPSNGNVSTR